MPKVVVYIPADRARIIERGTGQEIADWVRGLVRFAGEKKEAEILGRLREPDPTRPERRG